MSSPSQDCPFCAAPLAVVHVHGHGQCAHCGVNVEPCCTGSGPDDVAAIDVPELDADPALFARLFARLGGEEVTVTGDALRLSLAQWLGTGLDEAAVVIEAGVRVGRLSALPTDLYRLS